MRDDDEILEAYDRELGPEPRRPSNRGFWIVAGTVLAASAILVVEILANRSIGDTIGRAQHDLRVAEAEARSALATTGGFEAADAAALEAGELDGGKLSAVGPDEVSAGLGNVSVYADATTWAAAISVRPRACFFLKLVAGRDEPLYGIGTTCTGREALDASDSRW